MVSFLITVKNEKRYIPNLLDQLKSMVGPEDEIIFLSDFSEYSTMSLLENFKNENNDIDVQIYLHRLNQNFSEHKNYGKNQCNNKWIFQMDADEYMSDYLATNLHTLLEYNTDVDLIAVPRINIVNGLTQEDIRKWNWRVNEMGWVMWPDFQTRIFQNKPEIMWENKVHEVITGHKSFTTLPQEKEWALYHTKEIKRQREQNALYETI